MKTELKRECDAWARMKDDARKLPDNELRRHASVSESNRHSCVSCFCCACVAVKHERARNAALQRIN